jgi:hypothetical protein
MDFFPAVAGLPRLIAKATAESWPVQQASLARRKEGQRCIRRALVAKREKDVTQARFTREPEDTQPSLSNW